MRGFQGTLRWKIFGTASSSSCLPTQHFVSVTDFVTILCEVFITNVDILKFFFVIKRTSQRSWSNHFLPTENYENLKRFSGSLSERFEQPAGAEHDGIFTQETRQEKPEGVLLSQLHFKLPAKFKLGGMTSRLAAWPLNTCFKMAAAEAEILGFFRD